MKYIARGRIRARAMFVSDQRMARTNEREYCHGMTNGFNRRDFLRLSLVSGAGIACSRATSGAMVAEGAASQGGGGVVLFQGDSITDSGRNRTIAGPNVAAALGTGYPLLVASSMLRESDSPWRFFNRGVSGDKIPDLQARWSADTLALEPDVLSVLVGVNDFWHKRLKGYTGTVADYEAQYVDLLTSDTSVVSQSSARRARAFRAASWRRGRNLVSRVRRATRCGCARGIARRRHVRSTSGCVQRRERAHGCGALDGGRRASDAGGPRAHRRALARCRGCVKTA